MTTPTKQLDDGAGRSGAERERQIGIVQDHTNARSEEPENAHEVLHGRRRGDVGGP